MFNPVGHRVDPSSSQAYILAQGDRDTPDYSQETQPLDSFFDRVGRPHEKGSEPYTLMRHRKQVLEFLRNLIIRRE